MVQGLKLCSPNAGDAGSVPGQGTKIPHAATKTQCSQINKSILKKQIKKKTHSCLLGRIVSPFHPYLCRAGVLRSINGTLRVVTPHNPKLFANLYTVDP